MEPGRRFARLVRILEDNWDPLIPAQDAFTAAGIFEALRNANQCQKIDYFSDTE